MAHTIICLTHDNTTNQRGRRGKDLLRVGINKAMGCISGVERSVNFTMVGSGTDLVAANTAGISASGSGAVGMVIAGVTITDTWATSDTISAGLVAAAINASTNAKIQYLIGATNLFSSVSCATVLAGTTVEVAGFRFKAIAGTTESGKDGEFVIGGTDTADATSLALAINRHPYANKYLFAMPGTTAGDCWMFPKAAAWWTATTAGTPNFPPNRVTASAATVTVNSATFAANVNYGVYCKIPGKIGNNIVVAASGTGQTIVGSATYLARGLGMDAAPITDTL